MRLTVHRAALAVLLACPAPARAGGDAGQGGGFLRQEVGGRGAALAGAMAAAVDDATALRWNPAALGSVRKLEVAATHVTLFEDTAFDYVAGALPTRWGGVALGYVRQASGGFERRSTPFDAPVTFSITQAALVAGWGAALPLPVRPGWLANPRPLEVGFAFKSARESIDTFSASGNGLDLGLRLRPDSRFSLGVLAHNFVPPELTFVRRPARYARAWEVSPAYRLGSEELGVLLALGLTRVEGRDPAWTGGVELAYRGLAELRFGGADKGLSTGVGVRLGNTRFDYGVLLHDLGLSHVLSFRQRFGQTPQELEQAIQRGIRRLNRAEAERLAKAYSRSAQMKERMGRPTEALRDLEAAALLDPEEREYPDRIARLRLAIETSLRRRTVEGSAALARREFEVGNLILSRQYWQAVLSADPQTPEAGEYLARIEERLSREERRRARELEREQRALKLRERLAAAAGLLERGRLREAAEAAGETRRLFPESKEAGRLAEEAAERLRREVDRGVAEAAALLDQGDAAGALRAAEGARGAAPENAEAARIADKARAAHQTALTAEQKGQMERLYYRAVERYLKGDFREAAKLVAQVLQIDPAHDSARKLKEKAEAALRLTPP